ncbi:MAG: glycosyltransferase family 2 protein [Salinibacter sp.]
MTNSGSPQFSVVTPTLNSAATIRDTIHSVLEQTYPREEVEHVVVDGASSDGTVDILREYGHLQWTSEVDNGIFDGMNKGIRMAQGEIIGILNADDWYEPDALETVHRAFEEHPDADVVHGDLNVWHQGEHVRVAKPDLERMNSWRRFIGMPYKHPTMFVKREVYDRVGLFDTRFRLTADYEFVLRLHEQDVSIQYVAHPIANRRPGGREDTRQALLERTRVRHEYGLPWLAAFALVNYKLIRRAVRQRNG